MRTEQLDLSRFKWEITEDCGDLMYTCPECGCRMVKREYDIAVGYRGFSFCPYCGEDMRNEQITIEWLLGE